MTSCTTLPLCRNIYVSACIRYYPLIHKDSTIELSSPFETKIPSVLNVTSGNSGDGITTITLSNVNFVKSFDSSLNGKSFSTVTCSYQGTGVDLPQYPEEKAAAQWYNFTSCSSGRMNDIILVSGSIITHVDEGGTKASKNDDCVGFTLFDQKKCSNQNNTVVCTTLTRGILPSITAGPTSPSSSSDLTNKAVLIGSISGSVLILLLVAFFIVYLIRSKNKKKVKLEAIYDDMAQVEEGYGRQRSRTKDKIGSEDKKNKEKYMSDEIDNECTMISESSTSFSIPGFLLIDYNTDLRVEKILAEGGGGRIYLAELLNEGLREKFKVSKVAVKVLKELDMSKEEELNNFRQEVSIMFSLSPFKNIIKLIGFSENPMVIATKLYHQNLMKVVLDHERFQLLPELQASFARDIASGIYEMHNLGIAHRDLKSTNCLLEKLTTGEYTTYNIVICDFGLSIVDDQLLSSLKGQFKKSVMQGISFRYAAPEVFIRYGLIEKKTPETVDQAKMSDVYAFGIIIWELLERNIPWTTHSFQEVKEKVVNGERPPFMLRTGDSEETSRWSKAKILVSKQTLLRAQTLNAEDRIRRVLANLMTSCWVNDPSDRIPISKARADLIALTKKIRHVEDNNIILDE